MDDRQLIRIQTRLHGEETPSVFKARAEECLQAGDTSGTARNLRSAALAEEILAEEREKALCRKVVRPDTTNLFGGISGLKLEHGQYDLGDGVSLRSTYAHIMAPYIMAFASPRNGQPHPGPWRAASGGIGYDIEIELALPLESKPTNFDRLNTIWWILALLRLHHAVGIRVPVVANLPFSEATREGEELILWPIEMARPGWKFDASSLPPTVAASTLRWISDHYKTGADMMDDGGFNLAFRSLDESHSATALASSMLLIWSALEALFRPGRGQITHRLCAAIATFLNKVPSDRDAEYAKAKRLYESRGSITHAATPPEFKDVADSFFLARRCFILAIERHSVPAIDALLQVWRERR
jgi:hypothetical protein